MGSWEVVDSRAGGQLGDARAPVTRHGQGHGVVEHGLPAALVVAGQAHIADAIKRHLRPELLNRICKGRSMIVIEHDMNFVRQIADKVTVMHQGKILAEGAMEVVQADPRVIDVYLGH